jgi:hypothetical protein
VYLPPEGQTVEEEDEGHIEHPVPHITPVRAEPSGVRAEPSGGPSVSALTTLGHPEY